MSYIRCLSNPEGLYIWDDISRKIIISRIDEINVQANRRDFRALLRAYNNGHSTYKYASCKFSETDDFKIKLEVEGHAPIIMWHVTWAYICRHV